LFRSLYLLFVFSLLLILLPFTQLKPQWVNNPSVNNRFVFDASDPINISTAPDNKGGAFIFWEDNKSGFNSDIYFLHIDANGKPSFRVDGKRVSDLSGMKAKPITSVNLPNTSVVLWKDFSRNSHGDLLIQKVMVNGNLLWGNNGIRLSENLFDVAEYSVDSDVRGNTFVSYIGKKDEFDPEATIYVQMLDNNGRKRFPDGKELYTSDIKKSMSSVISDNAGGAYIFWVESGGGKSVLFSQHVDSTGNLSWGKKPLPVSSLNHNVVTYSAQKTDFNSVYIAWQTLIPTRSIHHQKIDRKGKPLWGVAGKPVTAQKGNNINPQVLTADSSIIVSWTNEDSDRNIFIQKFDRTGKPLWSKEGIAVIDFDGPQFGQKLLEDGKGGAIVTWIDRRVDSIRANIYAQRITSRGKIDWTEDALPVATYTNTDKSYVSIVSDTRGGIIAIFKEKRDGENAIYGQKIFNNGTYVSQIVGLTAQLIADSVKIYWYSANELGNTTYEIERSSQYESGGSRWKTVAAIYSEEKSNAKYYEYYDRPDEQGTIYYRITQSDNQGNIQPSDVVKLVILEAGNDYIVAQNSPNPFNKETIIGFNLPFRSRVKIEFYNSQVEKIREINDTFPAGQSKISFNASGLSPGIYFYRFTCNEFVDVKKMIITN
jgi:hypothetical protein